MDALTSDTRIINIANRLKRMARLHPFRRAVVYPAGWDESDRVAYTHLTFQQLDRESDCLAHSLEKIGIRRAVRTILMVRPSLEFFVIVFALFKVGAVPVIVDPGMGKERLLACLKEGKANGFIGIPKAQILRIIYRSSFKSVRVSVTVGKRWFWRGPSLEELCNIPWEPYETAETTADETAAILFTTGSTGPAKGVVYTHGIFDAQVRHIQSRFGIGSDEIDLPTFPLFSLFDPALGMTAIIPDMDPTRPAEADPAKLIEAIYEQGVTNMFASPALIARLAAYGNAHGIKLPTLRRAISAGAPVSAEALEGFSELLTGDAEIYTPYGATESMPVLSIGSREILSDTRKFTERGYGICVGKPDPGTTVRIIRLSDGAIEDWSDDLLVTDGEIGEIVVKGDVVTRQYFNRPTEDALHKIWEDEEIWHRMGDLGWQDSKGRVWFCGRKSHRVVTENGPLFTIPCESIFNQHPAVARSALVGVGKGAIQKAVLCIEPKNGGNDIDLEALKKEILNMAAQNPMTEEIKTVLFHEKFPVDIRHNAKIYREQLAEWAEKQ